MAKTHPQAVRAVIAHEAPLPRLHPQSTKWQRFFAGVNLTAYRFGSALAALQFMLGVELPVRQLIKASAGVNLHQKQSSAPYLGAKVATDVLAKMELLPVTNYLPDTEQLKRNGVKVFIAVGEWGLTRKKWYAEVAQILADRLNTELVTLPGHHGSFMDMREEFAAAVRKLLHKADAKT